MAKTRCFICVKCVVHAQFRFSQSTFEIDINRRVINRIPRENHEQIDGAGFHLFDKLA